MLGVEFFIYKKLVLYVCMYIVYGIMKVILRDICVYNIMIMYIELRKRSCSSNFDFLTDDVYSWCDCW